MLQLIKKYGIQFLSVSLTILLINNCTKKYQKIYYESGQLEIIVPLKNGKWQGDALSYYEDGNLKGEFYFEGGLLQGEGKFYFPNGNIMKHVFYHNDTIMKSTTFREDGTVEKQFDYKLPMGEGILYYPNGVIMQHVFYHNDNITKSATFREDGTLRIIKEYNDKGKLINFKCYLDSGKFDPDPNKRSPLIVSDSDTVKQGEIYRAEIRIGNRQWSNIFVFLGDTTSLGDLPQTNIKRINNEVSLVEIDTDTCELGLNTYFGQILEPCDTCPGGWVGTFKQEFFVLPR